MEKRHNFFKKIFVKLRVTHYFNKSKKYYREDYKKAKKQLDKVIRIIYKRKNEIDDELKFIILEKYFVGMSKIFFKEGDYKNAENFLAFYIGVIDNESYDSVKKNQQGFENADIKKYLEVQILRKKILKEIGNIDKVKEIDNIVSGKFKKVNENDTNIVDNDLISEIDEENSRIRKLKRIMERKKENIEREKKIRRIKEHREIKTIDNKSKEELQSEIRAQLDQVIDKYNKMDYNKKYKNGKACAYVKCLIDYLKQYDDTYVEKLLNSELIRIDEVTEKANLKRFRIYENINIGVLHYMSQLYENGIKSTDKDRSIIDTNRNKYGYYNFLANRAICQYEMIEKNEQELKEKIADIQENKGKNESDTYEELKVLYAQYLGSKTEKNKWNIDGKTQQQIKQTFIDNYAENEYCFFCYLEEKKNNRQKNGIQRLLAEARFIAEYSGKPYNSKYAELKMAEIECARVTTEKSKRKLEEIEKSIMDVINNGSRMEYRAVELLGEIYYNGIKANQANEVIVKPNKLKAEKIYRYLINEYSDKKNSIVYSNLLRIYNDNTLPIYDTKKVISISDEMKANEVAYQKEKNKEYKEEFDNKPYIYVCSDIHGERLIYDALIRELKEGDKLYILGDVIDRGEDGVAILQDIARRKEKGQVEFIIGNHEFELFNHNLFESLEKNPDLSYEKWKSDNSIITNRNDNTEEKTFNDFKMLSQNDRNRIKDFLLNSLVYKQISIDGEKIYLTHARAIQNEQEEQKILKDMIKENKMNIVKSAVWDRGGVDCNFDEIAKNGTLTIIGHTPTEGKIMYKENCIDIDCGVSYREEYNQALICLNTGKVKYFNYEYEMEKNQVKYNEK